MWTYVENNVHDLRSYFERTQTLIFKENVR